MDVLNERDIVDHITNLLIDTDYILNGELDRNYVVEQLNMYNSELIELLIQDDYIKNNYIHELSDGVMNFNIQSLVKQLKLKKYYNDSYTNYANEIGLFTEGKSINSFQNIVLNFPYKDTVLTAGMTKEDVDKVEKGTPSSKSINSLIEDVETEEVFLNEIINYDDIVSLKEPKALKNAKRYSEPEPEGIPTNYINNTDNLIIKGNNYVALNTIKNRYQKKVKLIYLDPPYYFKNGTDDDTFEYNSNFKLSTWLIFMKNRIEIALDFLRNDGYLVIQMNDHGVFHLKVLLDEIFENTNGGFVNHVSVKMSDLSGPKMAHVDKKIPKIKEHLLIYAMDYNQSVFNPQREPSDWDSAIDSKRYTQFVDKHDSENIDDWEYTTVRRKLKSMGMEYGTDEAYEFLINNADSVFRTAVNKSLGKISKQENFDKDKFTKVITETGLEKYVYKHEEVIFATSKLEVFNDVLTPSESISDIWLDISLNDLSNEGGKVTLSNGKKPEALLKKVIELTTHSPEQKENNEKDIVMDFFMGTATTQAVAMKLDRQFIGIEQLDYIKDKSVKRLVNTINGENRGITKEVDWEGGGSFVYAELYEDNQKYINELEDADNKENLWAIFERMRDVANFRFQVKLDHISSEKVPEDIPLNELKKLMIEAVKTSALYINANETEDPNLEMEDSDRAFNKSFFEGDENE